LFRNEENHMTVSVASIETAVQGVIDKIVNFEKLVWADFIAFENWLASMAPQADLALQELASLAQIAAPLAAANPGIGVALAGVVTVADEAVAVIHQVAANQAANKSANLVNTAHSIAAIVASVNTTHGAIAAAKGDLSAAISQAVAMTTTQPAPAAPTVTP
jgi:hypothetical protein